MAKVVEYSNFIVKKPVGNGKYGGKMEMDSESQAVQQKTRIPTARIYLYYVNNATPNGFLLIFPIRTKTSTRLRNFTGSLSFRLVGWTNGARRRENRPGMYTAIFLPHGLE